MEKTIIFTGGHHNSAIPLAVDLKNKGYNILFVGHKNTQKGNKELSSEYKEITSLGFNYLDLKTPKFYNNRNPLKYLLLINSLLLSFRLLIAHKPILIFSFGGYLAVPICLIRRLLRIKIVTHEQTVTVGMANKLIAKLANKVFLSWDISELKSNSKYIYVGLPLRKEILDIKPKDNNYSKFKTLFITGGKQASHSFNQFVFDNIENLLKDFKIIHQTGKHSLYADNEIAQRLVKKYGQEKYLAFDYSFGKEYQNILTNCDLLLSRSGAHIVYELSYLKIPTIFVPIYWVSQNEQYLNAQKANEYLPCVILKEDCLNYENFIKSVQELKNKCQENLVYKSVPLDAKERILKEITPYL